MKDAQRRPSNFAYWERCGERYAEHMTLLRSESSSRPARRTE